MTSRRKTFTTWHCDLCRAHEMLKTRPGGWQTYSLGVCDAKGEVVKSYDFDVCQECMDKIIDKKPESMLRLIVKRLGARGRKVTA